MRRLADEDTADGSDALDPLRDVHGVAGDRVREDIAGEQSGHHFARVHADADRDLNAVLALEPRIERVRRSLDL